MARKEGTPRGPQAGPAGEPQSVRIAYLFIPLPDFIPVPDRYNAQFAASHVDEDFGRRERTPSIPLDDDHSVTASLVFHQLEAPMAVERIALGVSAAARAFQWDEKVSSGTNRGQKPTEAVTVLEAAFAISNREEVSELLSVAAARVEDVQRALYVGAQLVLPPLTVRRLPPTVFFAVREAQPGETTPSWPIRDELGTVVNFKSAVFRQPEEVSEERLQAVTVAHSRGRTGPFGPLPDLRREYFLALEAGNTVAAAVLVGATAEILFRELHLHLCWEEGLDPRSYVEAAARLPISDLVRGEFHARLGGRWNEHQRGPVADWSMLIARLRNRVLHTGYRPDREEIDAASTAYVALERFIGDRLAASLRKYPLTAIGFLGRDGLARRGVERAFERTMAATFGPADPNKNFARWRREVGRHDQDGPWEGELASALLTLVLYLNGAAEWFLIDAHAGLACRAATPRLNRNQAQDIGRIRAAIAASDAAEHVTVRFERPGTPLDPAPRWIPAHSVMSTMPISRFPVSILPPHLKRKSSVEQNDSR